MADWNKKENVRERIRVIVKEVLLEKSNMKIDYRKINAIANEVLAEAERLYAVA
ncbi:type I restriction enzyme endonuclease domain-containing protein [Candidatus Aciduliprofundum boonei]|uniref:type I restriction enzyme endonuclease domain-containing protein n=1 Tax=Candidatus Aciduliprofundum boonei TaxID=379547 RepID=UPI0011D162FC|nr:DUF3387 domain-containing protein [Candidatus Aciduliprofundum boonei]